MYNENNQIQIYVPLSTYQQLLYDVSMFEVENITQLITAIIVGYAQNYIEAYLSKRDKILNCLSSKLPNSDYSEIADSIAHDVFIPLPTKRRGVKRRRVSFLITNRLKESNVLSEIEQFMGQADCISQFYGGLLSSYCSKPMYEREQIIFSDIYNKLTECIYKNRCITFWINDTEQTDFSPYSVCAKKDGTRNYLIGVQVGNSDTASLTRSYRLSGINKITLSKEPYAVIDEKTKNNLEKMILSDPQYAINETEEICVQLTEKGETIFKRIYSERPDYIRKEGSLYYFNCSPDQIFVYFRKLGKEAKIIYPESLRDRICEFFEETLTNYREDRNGK